MPVSEGVGVPRLEAEGELAVARIALDGDDPAHAATHLGNALAADPSLPATYTALEALDTAVPGGALELFPLDGEVFIGTVAARAHLCARAGKLDEALHWLTTVASREPDKAWTAGGWLDDPAVAAGLDPRAAAGALMTLAAALPDPTDDHLVATLAPFLDLARGIVAAHPDAVEVLPHLSALARRLGAVDEAVGWCARADQVCPSVTTAVMLGYALRTAGRVEDTWRAWLIGLSRDPRHVELHVDLAESMADHGRRPEGMDWLRRALALAPTHPKAFPSMCEMAFQEDGDVAHLVRLADHWRAHPDHWYADDRLAKASSGRPWLQWVPGPAEAICNVVRQMAAQYPDPDERRGIAGRCGLSALEPPSAMAAAAVALPGMAVDVAAIPSPDLRVPLTDVRYRVWTYHGTEAVAAGPPPSPEAAAALSAVARSPWRHPLAAYDDAVTLSALDLPDLLGLLGHVPPAPDDDPGWQAMAHEDPVYWPRLAQAWTCIGVLHHQADEPWPTSTRRAVLVDLAFGVEDWTTDAALNALVVAAWTDPAVRDDVATVVTRRFLAAVDAHRQREVTILESLAQLALVTPHLLPDVVALARDILASATAADGS